PRGAGDRVRWPAPGGAAAPRRAPRDNVLGSSSAKREEPAPAGRPESRPSFGSLGSVTPKEEAEPVAPEPVADLPIAQPPVPPSRTYADSAAEELDVPDFLK
ncbi:cell division protein FtsZ, partial [Streptomyces sp. NPDC054826]